MGKVLANMAGTVMEILVGTGEEISIGQDVIILESMKMEVPITAEISGKVSSILVNIGDFVNEDDVLLILE